MRAHRVMLVVTVVATYACKSDKPLPSAGSTSGAPVVEAPKPPPPPVDAAPPPATFSQTITSDGIGPITGNTDPSTLKDLFPGLQMKSNHEEGEDHSSDEYSFWVRDTHVLDAIVDNFRDARQVFRVDVYGSSFATPALIRVGSTIAEFVAKDDSLTCKRETYTPNPEHFEHALFCESAKLANLAFYLDDKALPGSDGKVVLAKVAPLKIVRIIWKNPQPPTALAR